MIPLKAYILAETKKTTAASIFKILLKRHLPSLKRPLILMYFQKSFILEL